MGFAKIDLGERLDLVLAVGDQAHIMTAYPLMVEWEDATTLSIKFKVPSLYKTKEIKPLLGVEDYQKDLSTVGELLGRILEAHKLALAEHGAMCEARQLIEGLEKDAN